MRRIESDVDLDQCHGAGVGLIYNDFSGSGAGGKDYNILHAAGCRWVRRSNTNVPKFYFTDLQEAVSWLTANRGPEGKNWRRCGTCKADAVPAPGNTTS